MSTALRPYPYTLFCTNIYIEITYTNMIYNNNAYNNKTYITIKLKVGQQERGKRCFMFRPAYNSVSFSDCCSLSSYCPSSH